MVHPYKSSTCALPCACCLGRCGFWSGLCFGAVPTIPFSWFLVRAGDIRPVRHSTGGAVGSSDLSPEVGVRVTPVAATGLRVSGSHLLGRLAAAASEQSALRSSRGALVVVLFGLFLVCVTSAATPVSETDYTTAEEEEEEE